MSREPLKDWVHAVAVEMERKDGLEKAAERAERIACQEEALGSTTQKQWRKVATLLERRLATVEGQLPLGATG